MNDLFICAICDAQYREGEEWFIMPDCTTVCSPKCGHRHLENKSCKRPSGTPRAAFLESEKRREIRQRPRQYPLSR